MNSKNLVSIINKVAALLGGACLFPVAQSDAAIVSPSTSVTVTQSYAYTSYNGGDFVFSTSAAAPGCTSGWYISSTDPGYKAAVASVLTAQAAGTYVLIYGDNSVLWSGSPSGQYCHVQAVGVTS
jgi:hypothetical protein